MTSSEMAKVCSGAGKELIQNGERKADVIVEKMKKLIEEEPLAKIDYVQAVDAISIQPVAEIKGTRFL